MPLTNRVRSIFWSAVAEQRFEGNKMLMQTTNDAEAAPLVPVDMALILWSMWMGLFVELISICNLQET